MNPVQLLLVGLVAGALAGLLILLATMAFVGFARAQRAALAGTIGAAIGFFLTALMLGPFFHDAKTLADLTQPMGIAAMVALGAAGLCASLILKAGSR